MILKVNKNSLRFKKKILYIESNDKLKRPWNFLLNSQGYNFDFNWDFQCTQPFTIYNAVVEMAPYDLLLNGRAVTFCKNLLRYGRNTFILWNYNLGRTPGAPFECIFCTMTFSNLKMSKYLFFEPTKSWSLHFSSMIFFLTNYEFWPLTTISE